MVDTFKSYLNYMSGLQYISDGNEISIKKGLISQENPEDNEQPLYITTYDNKWGNIKYPEDTSLTYNEVADINIKRIEKMKTDNLGLVNMADNTIEINEFSKLMKEDDPKKYNHAVIISLIIKELQAGKNVIYNPKAMTGYDAAYYDLLLEKSKSLYQSMELIFVPDFTCGSSASSSYFYKARIQTNQAIMFRPSEMLIKFLMMFLSLDDLSAYINGGSYEFMSRVRVGYIIKKTQKPQRPCAPVEGNDSVCGQKICLEGVCIPVNSEVMMVPDGSGPQAGDMMSGGVGAGGMGAGGIGAGGMGAGGMGAGGMGAGGMGAEITQEADLYMEGLDILYASASTGASTDTSTSTGASTGASTSTSTDTPNGGKKKRNRTLKKKTKGKRKGKKTLKHK
jgi:hypothetical protein